MSVEAKRAPTDLVDVVHEALCLQPIGASGLPSIESSTEELDARVRELVAEIEPLAGAQRVNDVCARVVARVRGLGPLHDFAIDPSVTEIMVNGDGSVWLEREGALVRTSDTLTSEETHHLIRRLASQVGRRIDQTNPSVDARLDDGSRLHGIIPPLAVDGPCLTVRRFPELDIPLEQLTDEGGRMILERAVDDEATIVVAGGTASGKTTLLNALGAFVDPDARVVTIEEAAELRLPGRHVIRLETRTAGEGQEAVGLRELLRNALRMRPDRIICGEMRGAEALDLVQAMNTGHPGSMSTVHANGVIDAMRRIETMMLLGDAELPLTAVRDQLASCLDLIVMMGRGVGRRRRVVEIGRVLAGPGTWEIESVFAAGGHQAERRGSTK